jgi:hypothetical protein
VSHVTESYTRGGAVSVCTHMLQNSTLTIYIPPPRIARSLTHADSFAIQNAQLCIRLVLLLEITSKKKHIHALET